MVSRRWLIAALAVLGLVGGCSQFNTNLTSQTSSSILTYLSPQVVTAGGADVPLTANGAGFVSGAIILWNVGPNQVQLTTAFVSSTQLTATLPASDITAAGTIHVAIQIPGSAVSGSSGTTATTTTEISNLVNFKIDPTPGPVPTITSLSASTTSLSSTPYCSPTGFTLTVAGSNFDIASKVNWNGSPRTTTFINSGQLTASILPQDAAFPGTASVSVSNASGTSTTTLFTMTTPMSSPPSPAISSISPISVVVGLPTFTLRVDGNFLPCTVVQWQANGSSVTSTLATTYVPFTPADPVHLNATVPAADLLAVGTAQVSLSTIGPGGGPSPTGITFTISP